MFRKKIIVRLYLPMLVVLMAITFYCSYKVMKDAEGKTYSDVSEIPYNRVGLLLGTCKTMRDHKTINPFWKFRLEAAYTLWKAHKIDRILISGDSGWHGYDEPKDFLDAFLSMGVPDSVMICDNTGYRTHDSVIRCKKVYGQKSVTIISQKFHNERALFIAGKYGLNAVGFNAQDVSFRDNLYNAVREKLARVLMFADLYVLHTQPHYLGKPVMIR